MSQPRLLDEVRTTARLRHLSLRTEKAYVQQIRRFILFHHKKHPKEMAETEIREFISHLAVNAKISASTQTVAVVSLAKMAARARFGAMSRAVVFPCSEVP